MSLNDQVEKPGGEVIFQQNAMPTRFGGGDTGAMELTVPSGPAYSSPSMPTRIVKKEDLAETVTVNEIKTENGSAEMRNIPAFNSQEQRPAWPSPVTFATPRGYHIPRATYEAAARLTPPDPSAYWQYDMFEGPGGYKEKVTLHYCNNRETMETVARLLLEEKVIGFDMKWMKFPRAGVIKDHVSLVQLASESRIALFHLARFPNAVGAEDFVTPALKQIMESPEITKVGASIKFHTLGLSTFLKINRRGLFELSNLHKLVMYCTGELDELDRKSVAMAKQAMEHFGLPVLKDEKIQCSDWTVDLNHQQTQYAATEPYANLLLFHIMEAKRLALNPVPPRPAHAELNKKIEIAEPGECIEDYLQAFECQCWIKPDDDGEAPARGNPGAPVAHSPKCRRSKKTTAGSSSPSTPKSTNFTFLPQTPNSRKSPSKSPSPRKFVNSSYAAQLERANKFVRDHQDPSNKYLTDQVLRVYSLWHEQAVDVPTIANICGNRPILKTTVIGYLYDALANLPRELHCHPQKIIDLTTKYEFSPYTYSHKMVLSTARFNIQQAEAVNGARTTS